MTNQFGKVLKMLRTKKGLTQKEVCERLNLTQSQVTNYETGRFEPSLDMVKQFAAFFGVSTDVLLSYSTETTDDLLQETFLEVQNTYYSLSEEQRKSFSNHIKATSRFLRENTEFL